jgi:hypothetical protein
MASFPKQFNTYNQIISTPGALSAVNNCYIIGATGTYTLPAISSLEDGQVIMAKNCTSLGGTVTLAPAGTDTINGGNIASQPLTGTSGTTGQGALMVASKTVTPHTWWVIVPSTGGET